MMPKPAKPKSRRVGRAKPKNIKQLIQWLERVMEKRGNLPVVAEANRDYLPPTKLATRVGDASEPCGADEPEEPAVILGPSHD
jgi:hypothetical protein